MGWWLPSWLRKRYNLCNHIVGRGQTSRQCLWFCFFFHVNRRPCFYQSMVNVRRHRPAACRGTVPGAGTAPAQAFYTKLGPPLPFTARGTAKAGDSSSLSRGPLRYAAHLPWWIPPGTCGNVSSTPYLSSKGRRQP